MEVALDLDSPIRTVSLSAPEDFSRHVSADSDIAQVAKEYAKVPDNFALEAGVYHGNNLSVSWKVSHKGHALESYPLEFEASRLQGNGSRVRLFIPSVVLPNCVAICDEGDSFIVDFITDSGYLYTVHIPHSWSRNGSEYSKEIDINDLTYRIVRQYSLDLVAPRILKAVSPHTSLMALIDGSLVRLDRTSPQDPPTSLTLSHDFGKPSGSGLARFFRPSNDTVPGHPRFSVNAASALEVIGTCAVTYAINSKIHVWSLQTNSCVQTILPDNANCSLRLRPTSYIAHNESTIAIAFPDAVKLYKLEVSSGTSAPQDEGIYTIPEEIRTWFVTSLGLLDSQRVLVSFRKDLCARVYIAANNEWKQVGGYDHTTLMDLPITNSLEKTKQRVLETNPAVVKSALSQSSKSYNPSSAASDNADETISAVLSTLDDKSKSVFANHSDTINAESQWSRSDTLCREIQTQGGESLAIAPALSTHDGLFLWSLRVSGVSIFCVQDVNDEEKHKEDNEVYEIGHDLLGNIPEAALERVTEISLSPDLLVNRIELACSLLRNYIHQKKLNDMGRNVADKVAPALRRYINTFGPAQLEATETSSCTPLSQLGKDAVTMLVYDFAKKYSNKFELIASLTTIALVEGWLSGHGDSDSLCSTVEVLRRYTFIKTLGSKHLHLNVENVALQSFGIALARSIAFDCNEADSLYQMLPPNQPEINSDVLVTFDRAVTFCNPSPDITLLSSMAYLSTGHEDLGLKLARRVSLSRPWPSRKSAAKPESQAMWFYEMARYASTVSADDAALQFTQLGASLSIPDKHTSDLLLELLFTSSIKGDNIPMAYTALTRRFPGFRESQDEDRLVDEWIKTLINAAAHASDEDARSLVVSYPFIGFARNLQRTLASTQSFATIPSYKSRYAWYIEREDFVGASEVLYKEIHDDESTDYARKTELYTVCLNSLASAPPESRWLHNGDEIVHFDDIKLQQDQMSKKIVEQIDMDD